MRQWLVSAVLVAAWAAPRAGGEGVPDRAPRLAEVLREGVEGLLPVPSPSAPQTEPAGDVRIDLSPNAKPLGVLAEAHQMEQEGNWRGAAELYQRLIEEAPDQLCQPSPRLYVPMRTHVEERLARFPPGGLAAYRDLVDRHAQRLYREAVAGRDVARLKAVAARYLLSSVGDNALDHLATRSLARGDPGQAFQAWERLLRLCRDTDVDLASLTAKLVVCLDRLGQQAAARALLERAAEALGPQTTIPLGGQPTTVAALASLLGAAAPPALDEASWPYEGGDRAHARASPAALRPGRLAWSDVILSREAAEALALAPRRFDPYASSWRREPTVTVSPIVTEGLAVCPMRAGLVARDLATGKMEWEARWPRAQDGELMLDPFADTGSWEGRWAASAEGGRVFFTIPLKGMTQGRERRVGGELVALEARTGAQLWRRSVPEDLPQAFESAWFTSAPLPCGERLVVGLRAGASGEDYYLCSYRARDGEPLWRRYVCSRMPESWYRAQYSPASFEGMPAESKGLVVTCASGGIVAAAELATGRLRWLARYDQLGTDRRSAYRRSGWETCTPIIADGVVYATPPDSDYLYAFDLGSGRLLWRAEREGYAHLVGVRDGKAYLAGSEARCLNALGEAEWTTPLPTAVAARPALAGRALHLPLAGGILYLDAATGGELAWAPWTEWRRAHGPTWQADIASGDVLVAAGKLFVVTPYSINLFEPLGSRDALREAVAARPDDPAAHYAWGQELHWRGDTAKAAEHLQKALALLAARPTGLSRTEVADARRRLATCYDDLARRYQQAGQLELALRACEDALRHAADPATRAALRLRVADLASQRQHWAMAVDACQQVLAETEPRGSHWQAGRARLATILRQAGREPYARFDQAAADALARGTQDDLTGLVERYPNSQVAPVALLRLAEAAQAAGRAAEARAWLYRIPRDYPASEQVPEALYRLAEGYARGGSRAMARGALETLRQAYPTWRAQPELPPAAELRADAFLDAHCPAEPPEPAPPKPPLRIQWHVEPQYGSADLHVVGDPAWLPDAFFVLAGLSLERRSVANGSMRWADRPGWIGIYIRDAPRPGGGVQVESVVRNTPGERAGLRSGDVIVGFDGKPMRDCPELIRNCSARRSGTAVQLRILRDDAPLAITLTLGERPTQRGDLGLDPGAFVGVAEGHVLLRQATRMDALRAEDGSVAWSFEAEGAAGSPEDGRVSAANPGVVVLADSRGRLAALDPARGHLLWTRQLDEPTIHGILLWEHGVVVASSSPATVRVLNPFDGRVTFHAVERHTTAAPRVVADGRARLYHAMGSTVGCYDVATGRPAWGDRIRNFTAGRLWAAGPMVVAHGVDRRGVEAFEGRRADAGAPLWARALGRGENLVDAALEPDALYIVTRRAAQSLVRRLDGSTGEVSWTRELERDEKCAAWEPSGVGLGLGLTTTDLEGQPRAHVRVLDKLTGAVQQQLDLGPGTLTVLRRLGGSLFAVVEGDLPEQELRFRDFRDAPGEPARFRVVRIVGAR